MQIKIIPFLIEFNKSREILKNFGSNFKQFGQKCEDQTFRIFWMVTVKD